ncbi:Dachshund-like protein 1 [Armadillidium vulgare]|nr:Dachshund-like protein 1 [Armadillidium vulgare]
MTMTTSPEALFDLKKRHLENGIGGGSAFPNGHIGNDPRLDKSPLLANGYHAPPHFNPLQYMAHHMAGLGYPHLLPTGLPGGVPGAPGGHPHQLSPPETSPMKQITPETLARLHEERVERERQMMLDARRGLPPTSLSGIGSLNTSSQFSSHTLHLPSPLPPSSTSNTQDDHQPPSSPILNLTKTMSIEGCPPTLEEREDEEEDREVELRSHGSSSHREEDSSRRLNNKPSNESPSVNSVISVAGVATSGEVVQRTEEERLSDMDEEEGEKDESMDTGDMWSLNSSTPGMTQLTPPPQNAGANPLGFGGSAPLSSTEVLLRNILGLLRVAEENARHHERQTQYEKAELKMEVLRERELRETLEKQLQEEQKNRIIMQKRCVKLKKLRRRLQERLDLEVKRRSRYEDHIRSASPDVLNDINGSLRKDMEAIAKELQQENLHQQQQQQKEEERNKESVDRLLASPSLANHPAIAAANAVANNNSWR